MWTLSLASFLICLATSHAYRPVQHCKHVGDNGHYSACTALTTTQNTASGHLDLYIRYHWYRYENSAKGWHAIALGEKMTGAHMLVMYGDPAAADGAMTVSIRTANGHHPPRPVTEFEQFKGHSYPNVTIDTARFEKYTGEFVLESLKQKPTHVGIVEAIIPSFSLWPGTRVIDNSEEQPFIWSSNFKQDFGGVFDSQSNIDMHVFGNGFGFLKADLKNAKTPQPMYGPIDELAGLKGASEVDKPAPATKEELEEGDKFIAAYIAANGSPSSTEESSPPSDDKEHSSDESDNDKPTEPPQQDDATPVEQPARTILGKTLRDWMWHLHGIMMCFSFLALYPLGLYLLRRPPPSAHGNGFNSHWTIQSLASVALLIGAGIGYVNSHSISIVHQYIGITMVLLVGTQIFLGWRHHVIFIATHRRTIFNKLHVWTGRVIMPLGLYNIISGMLLRHYGWFTLVLVLALMVLESSFLVFVLTTTRNIRTDLNAREQNIAMRDEEAEEYFQLAGDDDDDWSDGEGGDAQADASGKQEERRKQAERLAKLDKV